MSVLTLFFFSLLNNPKTSFLAQKVQEKPLLGPYEVQFMVPLPCAARGLMVLGALAGTKGGIFY